MSNRRPPGIPALTALAFQSAIGVVGLVIIVLLDIPVPLLGHGLWHSLLWGATGAALTYAGLLWCTRIPGLLPDTLERQMQGLYDFAVSYSPAVLVCLSLLAGIGEELLFRGAVQGGLLMHTPAALAVLGASVLFGLVHWVSFTYFLIATGLGLILGVAYLLSESIVLVMLWHAVYDVIALFCLLRFPHWFGVRRIRRGGPGRQE